MQFATAYAKAWKQFPMRSRLPKRHASTFVNPESNSCAAFASLSTTALTISPGVGTKALASLSNNPDLLNILLHWDSCNNESQQNSFWWTENGLSRTKV